MIRLDLRVELRYQVGGAGADFLFDFHAAKTRSQILCGENLTINQAISSRVDEDPVTGNRYLRLRALPGPLTLQYAATVDLQHHQADPLQLAEVPVYDLPVEAIGYLYPSRYCQSDRFVDLAANLFGGLPRGYGRATAICDWVKRHVSFTFNSSNAATSAIETFADGVGICRDFAHLMIALCRAINLPARFVTGTDYGADPALGPPDFHAYVEVFLGDRWYIFDPSGTGIPMGFVRIATGRDAADAAFACIFGAVGWQAPVISATPVEDASRNLFAPRHCDHALSTSDPAEPVAARASS